MKLRTPKPKKRVLKEYSGQRRVEAENLKYSDGCFLDCGEWSVLGELLVASAVVRSGVSVPVLKSEFGV